MFCQGRTLMSYGIKYNQSDLYRGVSLTLSVLSGGGNDSSSTVVYHE